MVMMENLSRFMDGDLDDREVDAVGAALASAEALATWTCYHVIGDTLRGEPSLPCGSNAAFRQRLAAEPTVLAPQRRRTTDIGHWAWGAAATVAAITVVGWTAVSVIAESPAAMAKAREATAVSANRVRPSGVPADYLIAHQEYSPAASIQGVGPYLRAATAQADRP
jgi:sigma-E factor negative regulatory protein RseA